MHDGDSKDGTGATAAIPATAPVVIPGIQTGGGGEEGLGFTLTAGIDNVSLDLGYSQAYGSAYSAGFGSAQGTSIFGTAGVTEEVPPTVILMLARWSCCWSSDRNYRFQRHRRRYCF